MKKLILTYTLMALVFLTIVNPIRYYYYVIAIESMPEWYQIGDDHYGDKN